MVRGKAHFLILALSFICLAQAKAAEVRDGLMTGLTNKIVIPTRGIHDTPSGHGCTFSATLSLLPELETANTEEYSRILNGGLCQYLSKDMRLLVVKEFPHFLLVIYELSKVDGLDVFFVRKMDVRAED